MGSKRASKRASKHSKAAHSKALHHGHQSSHLTSHHITSHRRLGMCTHPPPSPKKNSTQLHRPEEAFYRYQHQLIGPIHITMKNRTWVRRTGIHAPHPSHSRQLLLYRSFSEWATHPIHRREQYKTTIPDNQKERKTSKRVSHYFKESLFSFLLLSSVLFSSVLYCSVLPNPPIPLPPPHITLHTPFLPLYRTVCTTVRLVRFPIQTTENTKKKSKAVPDP